MSPDRTMGDGLQVDHEGEGLPVSRERLESFVALAFIRCGVRRRDAAIAARVIVLADARGIPSHGVARIGQYVANIRAGLVKARPDTTVVSRRAAAELWHADNGLGHPVAHRAALRVVRLARRAGVGLVGIQDSSHFGIAGAYVRDAMAAGMIGMAMTNADPNVAVTGSNEAGLGTNPIAIGAAGLRHAFLLDMATSVVPAGRLEVALRRHMAIPEGWAVDADGGASRDPSVLERGGRLLPLGGQGVEHGGHKGFGLAAAVDLLSGVLPDTAWTLGVRSLFTVGEQARVGHLVVAIDPGAFGDVETFRRRVDAWIGSIKTLQPCEPGGEVLVAGEREARAEMTHGVSVTLHPAVAAELEAVAGQLALSGRWRGVLSGLGGATTRPASGRAEPGGPAIGGRR